MLSQKQKFYTQPYSQRGGAIHGIEPIQRLPRYVFQHEQQFNPGFQRGTGIAPKVRPPPGREDKYMNPRNWEMGWQTKTDAPVYANLLHPDKKAYLLKPISTLGVRDYFAVGGGYNFNSHANPGRREFFAHGGCQMGEGEDLIGQVFMYPGLLDDELESRNREVQDPNQLQNPQLLPQMTAPPQKGGCIIGQCPDYSNPIRFKKNPRAPLFRGGVMP